MALWYSGRTFTLHAKDLWFDSGVRSRPSCSPLAVVLAGCAPRDFCNLADCAASSAAGFKIRVYNHVSFHCSFKDVSVEKVRDSQIILREMLQQFEEMEKNLLWIYFKCLYFQFCLLLFLYQR